MFVEFESKVVVRLFKYMDFFASIDVNYQFKHIYNKTVLENCIPYDLSKIKKLAENMIMIAPFIQNKDHLIEKCKYFTP